MKRKEGKAPFIVGIKVKEMQKCKREGVFVKLRG